MQCSCGSTFWIEERLVSLVRPPVLVGAQALARNQHYRYRCAACGQIVAPAQREPPDPRQSPLPRGESTGL